MFSVEKNAVLSMASIVSQSQKYDRLSIGLRRRSHGSQYPESAVEFSKSCASELSVQFLVPRSHLHGRLRFSLVAADAVEGRTRLLRACLWYSFHCLYEMRFFLSII